MKKNKSKKYYVISIILLVLSCIGLLIVGNFIYSAIKFDIPIDSPCSSTIISQEYSPNNSFLAILKEVNCGAMSSNYPSLSIVSTNDATSIPSVVYIGYYENLNLTFRWTDDSNLLVSIPNDSIGYTSKSENYSSVKITYE